MTAMRQPRFTMACLAAAVCFGNVALAGTTASPSKGEIAAATATVTATVVKIDQQTREVTLRRADGEEVNFVAGDKIKNLAQVKIGDTLTATYSQALAYEVKKGGSTAAPSSAMAGSSAEPGQKPAGAVVHERTVTVVITAIDRKVPSVTFKGPQGNTRTIKVLHPDKLKGVSVGDTVEITYTEALALKVEDQTQH